MTQSLHYFVDQEELVKAIWSWVAYSILWIKVYTSLIFVSRLNARAPQTISRVFTFTRITWWIRVKYLHKVNTWPKKLKTETTWTSQRAYEAWSLNLSDFTCAQGASKLNKFSGDFVAKGRILWQSNIQSLIYNVLLG